jgi:hypothetical protein
MAHDKRLGKRFPVKLTVSTRSEAQGMLEQLGETRDVSPGGVYFYADREISRESEIEIILPLPPNLSDGREAWVLCRCKVVRIEPAPDGRHGIGALIQSYELVPEV